MLLNVVEHVNNSNHLLPEILNLFSMIDSNQPG